MVAAIYQAARRCMAAGVVVGAVDHAVGVVGVDLQPAVGDGERRSQRDELIEGI